MADIGVGIVGFGLAGAVFHAPLIDATPGLRIDAIVTRDPERIASARRSYPAARVVADVPALLATGVDVVVVATPNRFHVPVAMEALGSGRAVAVDKPVAARAEDAAALVDAASAAGALLTVYQNRRFDGDFMTVRSLVEGGELGTVHRFESRMERWRPVVGDGWRELGDPADGGGLLLDLGVHLVDQALQLLGPVVSVYAEVAARRPGARVDDDVFVALAHASGAVSHLYASSTTAHIGPRFRVLGDKCAYVKFDEDGQEAALKAGGRPDDPGWTDRITDAPARLSRAGDVRDVPTLPGDFQRFYRELRDAVQAGDASMLPVDPGDAVTALRVLDAARRSARERRVIAL